MNFKKYHVSRNLFDRTGENVGYYVDSNGDLVGGTSAAGWTVSDYIEIEGNTQYTFNPNTTVGNSAKHCFYNDQKQPFASYIINSGQQTFTTPSGAKYARFSYRDSSTDIMLNLGSTALPYEPYGDTWHDTPHYIHNTSTDTITTPADIYANDTTATVGLKGQMSQSSTPTPSSPITPSECGERTGNLVDYTQSETGGIDNSGNLVPAINLWRSTVYTAIDATLQYFVSWTSNTNLNAVRINYYASDKTHILRETLYNSGTALTIPQNAAYFKWTLYAKSDFTVDLSFVQSLQLMINSGSTALPYEPYGIKIPILSNSTTTPVYLGEVQSTRRIKKLVLTGSETWSFGTSDGRNRAFLSDWREALGNSMPLCTHYNGVGGGGSYPAEGNCLINSNGALIFNANFVSDKTEWITYLQQQYAAGTPVTIWYVLATPETAVVNEPIRKLGTYADEVSGITIPTIAGANAIDVLTTLKPSEVSVNYHGWHPVSAVHEAENGQWD